jgi:hypothetical protein
MVLSLFILSGCDRCGSELRDVDDSGDDEIGFMSCLVVGCANLLVGV